MKKYHLGLLAAVLLLNACLPPAATPTLTPTLPPTRPPATRTPFWPATATSTSPPPTATATPRIIAKRALIITVDGLRPDVIAIAPMPNLLALMESGTYSLSAQTIFPSSTLPAHASMFTGMCPDKHGVLWNDYLPDRGFANGPTIFDIAHEFGLKTVIVAGKEKIQQIARPESLDIFKFVNDRDSVVAAAAAPTIAEGFGLMLIHLPLVDILGHEYGWLSPNYIIGAYRADETIGMILAALEEAGLRQDTLIIVTADHGGDIKFKHGGRSPAAMTVPWVLSGTSLKPMELTRPISVTDTAATIAYALDLPIPTIWDGIPVIEAFGEPAPTRVDLPCK